MNDDLIIAQAKSILASRFSQNPFSISTPQDVKDYLQLHLGEEERELFCVIFLNTRHQVLLFEVLFSGTVNKASVYPREIFKKALSINSSALILAHNHPSGVAEPSNADIALTEQIKTLGTALEINVLDHIICSGIGTVSLAERGLI